MLPDPGGKELLAIAFAEWRAGNLQLKGGTTATEALEKFSADVLALVEGADPNFPADEEHEWTEAVNLQSGDFVAVGPTTSEDIFCFPNAQWCFQVVTLGDTYHFAAEAIADQNSLGECVGSFPNDCEQIGIHMDVSPDDVVGDLDVNGNLTTFINVWSCVSDELGPTARHARFQVNPDGTVEAGVFGFPGDPVPAELQCGGIVDLFKMNDFQRSVWNATAPLRWVFEAEPLNAAGTGTTFARASFVQGGDLASIRVRDIVVVAKAKFASVSDGAEVRLFKNMARDPIDGGVSTTDTDCTTVGDGQRTKTGRCTLVDIPVPDDISYYAVVDKQDQTGTAHHAEDFIELAPGDPARDEFLECEADLDKGTIVCSAKPISP